MFRVELQSSNVDCQVSANTELKKLGIRKHFFDSVAYLTKEELDSFNSTESNFVCTVAKVSLSDKGLRAYQKLIREYNKTEDKFRINNVLKATHNNNYDKIVFKQTSAMELSDLFGMMAGAR